MPSDLVELLLHFSARGCQVVRSQAAVPFASAEGRFHRAGLALLPCERSRSAAAEVLGQQNLLAQIVLALRQGWLAPHLCQTQRQMREQP